VQTTFSSLNQSKSSSLKSKPNVGPALTTNPSKKK